MSPRRKRKKRGSRYHTGEHMSVKLVGRMKYRSGWELLWAVHMDNDPTVENYSYESVIVPYVSNVRSQRIRRYFVDFLVTYSDGHRMLVEVKPSHKLTQKTVVKKLESAQRWCEDNGCTLSVITEVELKQLGCL